VTSLCYILLNKFVALVGSGRQTCRPSHDEKGLKDWAIGSVTIDTITLVKRSVSRNKFCTKHKCTEHQPAGTVKDKQFFAPIPVKFAHLS
jgi:hypothetical protein